MPTLSKILIVEDDPSVRTLLSEVFRQLGHEVRSAEDGFSALARIRESAPDVLLSDLHMPGMSGFELLSVVRRRLPKIYVIATSGAYTGKDVPQGVAADAFYEKASSLLVLLEMMEAAGRGESAKPRGPDAAVSLWIAAGTVAGGIAQGIVTCPDCLRAFPQVFLNRKTGIAVMQQTDCAFCGQTIHYAVVQVLDPATALPHHAKMMVAPTMPEELHEPGVMPIARCA